MSDSTQSIFIAPKGLREVVFQFQNHETDLTNKFLFSDGGSTRRFISAPPKVATPSPSLFHQTSLLPEDLRVSKIWTLHWPL